MGASVHTLAEIPFPDARAVVAADARRFQSLPPLERWRRLFALRSWGAAQQRKRSASGRDDASEARWREIQLDLFQRHGR